MGQAMNAGSRRSRAVDLLIKIIASNESDVPRVAAELVVDEQTIDGYMSGEIEMPLDRQLCFARYLIDRIPSQARNGRNLLAQVQAAVQFAQSETVVHPTRPVPNSRSF